MDKKETNAKNTHWNDNGKGESWRKGSNLKRFRDNYDKIFRKEKVAEKKS